MGKAGKSPTNTQTLRHRLANMSQRRDFKMTGKLDRGEPPCAPLPPSLRPSPRGKTKKASPARIEANRRNAQKSCGPKTDEGKARSRFNALKHGMTAKTVLLPGEDGQAFANRLRYLQNDLQPRNSLEGVLIERLAGDVWKADRSELSLGDTDQFPSAARAGRSVDQGPGRGHRAGPAFVVAASLSDARWARTKARPRRGPWANSRWPKSRAIPITRPGCS